VQVRSGAELRVVGGAVRIRGDVSGYHALQHVNPRGRGFGLLVEDEGERDGVEWVRRGEARIGCARKVVEKRQGEMEMEEPYRDFDPFLSSPGIP
jgi:hypothetical protein